MIEITCSGTPYQIGHEHGSAARKEVLGSIKFYGDYFLRLSKLEWTDACAAAGRFLPKLERDWPDYVEEMKGVADGAQVPFESILALNVRTEIAMGMMTDGCTSLAWKDANNSFLAQNWDWEEAQRQNIIVQHIKQKNKPGISQVTEGGIIGKIGLNSSGVGTALNAIRSRGVDFNRLPGHLALRAILDCTTREEAVALLEREGVASAMHILIADASGSTSIESSSLDLVKIESKEGKLAHTNHFLEPHAAGVTPPFFKDSFARMDRVTKLMLDNGTNQISKELIETILQDEDDYPSAINRAATTEVPAATLFSIVMDVVGRQAWVKIGRPTAPEEEFYLHFA